MGNPAELQVGSAVPSSDDESDSDFRETEPLHKNEAEAPQSSDDELDRLERDLLHQYPSVCQVRRLPLPPSLPLPALTLSLIFLTARKEL